MSLARCLLIAFALLFIGQTVSAETADEFTARMTEVSLVGRFTVDAAGRDGDLPRKDRYEIASIEQVRGNQFRVNARIAYPKADGEKVDITVPILVNIDFASGTPLLSVTDLKIPLLGEGFSSRVVFDGDRYAGTWQHGKVGGHMWGRIEPIEPDTTPVAP